jgi:NADH-quinone oxidoreductase subunit L
MGGLRKYMPITWITSLVGSLALAGVPPFAGFFSKDAIIEAAHFSTVGGHTYAYYAVLFGVFITAFYSFRMLFLAFHGRERFDPAAGPAHDDHAAADHDAGHDAGDEPDAHAHEGGPPKESPWVVTAPLILLAIPSVYTGWVFIEPMLFGNYFGSSIVVLPAHAAIATMKEEWQGAGAFVLHGLLSVPFALAIAGIVAAWYCYIVNPALPGRIAAAAGALYRLLDRKYYFDEFYDRFFAGGSRGVGGVLSEVGDRTIIDGFFVNGTARVIFWGAALLRYLQSGFIYHYAFAMIFGLFAFLTWLFWVPRI